MINMKRLQNPINKYESRIAIELLEIKQVLQHVPGVENPADLLTKLRKTNWLNLSKKPPIYPYDESVPETSLQPYQPIRLITTEPSQKLKNRSRTIALRQAQKA